jgi:hypothetical protein
MNGRPAPWEPASRGSARRESAAFSLARRIQADHIDHNHWSDSGQHFTVSRGGVILEGRHTSYAAALKGQVPRGAHAGNTKINATMFGIEDEGTFRSRGDIPSALWLALVDLCAHLAWWGNFDTVKIYPHKLYRPTACPGFLEDMLPDLRRAAHARKLELIGRGTA